MKQKFLSGSAAALLLTAATFSSFAADNYADLFGDATTPAMAGDTITIGPQTSYVNVTHGDIVKFTVGDKSFAWRFDGPATISEFDLNKVAPAGMLDHTVKAYIKRTPDEDGA